MMQCYFVSVSVHGHTCVEPARWRHPLALGEGTEIRAEGVAPFSPDFDSVLHRRGQAESSGAVAFLAHNKGLWGRFRQQQRLQRMAACNVHMVPDGQRLFHSTYLKHDVWVRCPPGPALATARCLGA